MQMRGKMAAAENVLILREHSPSLSDCFAFSADAFAAALPNSSGHFHPHSVDSDSNSEGMNSHA
jgi:hypothetical protein